ncbi:rhomboid-like protein [Streptomyces heilongjiangensis]|uniref:Rhomboid-like protein n=1 Tax=Streptomyces heilongjiangensis TaxID=945052 RepID=A0ABW1BIL4_9ACTN|nr:rhomboid-like protein [Streptomyces heilongjiangensis]MDC2945430.1 hypothetical protein [Streptomyces heilongjiangensis]
METGAGPDRTDGTPPAAGPFLDGIPRQPGAATPERGGGGGGRSGSAREQVRSSASRSPRGPAVPERRARPARTAAPGSLPRPWRLLPTPTGTPFTFWYLAVLVVTSLVTEYADPTVVHALHQGFSTDVAHLASARVPVLVGSALWIAGGVASPYVLGLVLVLTALERRIGGRRTAAVFLLGHVLATLATEVPVGLAVLAGELPGSSLHRLDHGISFGVAASVGALAGLLPWWSRLPLLLAFGWMLLDDLMAFTDPMTNWGHLIALGIGVATWPWARRWRHAAAREAVAPPAPPRPRRLRRRPLSDC